MVTGEGQVVRLRRGGRTGGRADGQEHIVALDRLPACPPARLAHWPKVRKNSFGYALDEYARSGDALDLVIGAEGTLGIMTAVEWRLDRIPTHRAGVRILLDSYAAFPTLIADLLTLEVSALELLDRTFLEVVRTGDPAVPLLNAEAGGRRRERAAEAQLLSRLLPPSPAFSRPSRTTSPSPVTISTSSTQRRTEP